jgi:arginyl-tRNA---protein transferase
LTLFRPDVESLEWNLLDDEYRRKLDARKYVSPSRDRKTRPLLIDEPSDGVATPASNPDNGKEQDTRKIRANEHADDEQLELDDEDSENDDADIPEGSLFDYDIPGVLSKDEVSKLDLSRWKLLVRASLIDLEVLALTRCLAQLTRSRIYEDGKIGRSTTPGRSKVLQPR